MCKASEAEFTSICGWGRRNTQQYHIVVVNACWKSNFLLCKKMRVFPGWLACVDLHEMETREDGNVDSAPLFRHHQWDIWRSYHYAHGQVFGRRFLRFISGNHCLYRVLCGCAFGSYFMQSFSEPNRCLGKFAAVIARK